MQIWPFYNLIYKISFIKFKSLKFQFDNHAFWNCQEATLITLIRNESIINCFLPLIMTYIRIIIDMCANDDANVLFIVFPSLSCIFFLIIGVLPSKTVGIKLQFYSLVLSELLLLLVANPCDTQGRYWVYNMYHNI